MKLYVIDTETDSLETDKADILEVAVASLDLVTYSVDLVLDTLIQPEKPAVRWQSCWFLNQSGLRPEDFVGAPRFSEIAGRLQRIVDGSPVTAFNLAFDLAVLERHGIIIKHLWPCLMLTCTPILQIDNGMESWKWPAFREAWRYFFPGSDYRQQHRAGSDALHEAMLARALVRQGYFDALSQRAGGKV